MRAEFDYFARRGALLFPCLKTKAPNTPLLQRTTGKARPSFSGGDASGNPETWAEWLRLEPDTAFGVWAGGSRLIIVDIDTKGGREAAWQRWREWCASHGLPTYQPHVQTPSGGWHVYFAVPDGIDATILRQPDLVRIEIDGKKVGVINTRAGSGYVLVPPSEGYLFFDITRDPYSAPDALVKHCANVDFRPSPLTFDNIDTSTAVFDPNLYTSRDREIARLKFMSDVAVFAQTGEGSRNQELNAIAFKHAGSVRAGLLDPAEYETALMDACEQNGLLADDGEEQCIKTILSAIGGAQRKNVNPQAPKPISVVFAGIDLGQAQTPKPGGTMALFGQTAQYVADLGLPIIEDMMKGLPNAQAIGEHPCLPDTMADHPLYSAMQEFLSRMFALIETAPNLFTTGRVAPALGVLFQMHEQTFDVVCRRIYSSGVKFNEQRARFAAKQFADRIQREMLTLTGWQTNARGEPESDNPDNVRVLLRMLECEVRYNAWTEQAEIKGGPWEDWTSIDDPVVAKLMVIGAQSGNRFTPGVEFFWRTLGDIARDNTIDPALSLLESLEAQWDGLPRLDTWLEIYCGLTDTMLLPYYRAVSHNVVGGIVKRIREPGCKHDEVMILMGPQGLGKSSLCRLLALRDEWFSDEVLLGDASKELVLALRGKAVFEISELGGMAKRDVDSVKAMLSRQVDRGRPAFGRAVQERPRRCIFVGSTNDMNPLQDETGNRRYLPVPLSQEPNLDGLRAALPQIFAEACVRHRQGERFTLPREVWPLATMMQEQARARAAYEITLEHIFGRKDIATMQQGEYIAAGDLVTFATARRIGGGPKQWGATMRALGFVQTHSGTQRNRIWLRGPRGNNLEKDCLQWVVTHSPVGGANLVLRGEASSMPQNVVAFPAFPIQS